VRQGSPKKLPFDFIRDTVPVAGIMRLTNMMVVPTSLWNRCVYPVALLDPWSQERLRLLRTQQCCGSSDEPSPFVNVEFHQAFVSHFQ
jgi:hypothetical protein